MTFRKLGFRVAEILSFLSTLSRVVFHIFTTCPSSESVKHRSTDTHLHTFPVQSNVYTSASIVACHLCDMERADTLVRVRRSRAAFRALHVCTHQPLWNWNELFVVSLQDTEQLLGAAEDQPGSGGKDPQRRTCF